MIAGKWRLLDGIEPIKAGDKSLDGFGWTTLTEADEGLAASCFLLVKRPMTPAEEHAEDLAVVVAGWLEIVESLPYDHMPPDTFRKMRRQLDRIKSILNPEVKP